jgi:hypothetical protein
MTLLGWYTFIVLVLSVIGKIGKAIVGESLSVRLAGALSALLHVPIFLFAAFFLFGGR